MRVDFQFDKAAFAFNALPFKLPYPVPFKLLGDETKVTDLLFVCCLTPVLQLCCKDLSPTHGSPGLLVWLPHAYCCNRDHSFNVDALIFTLYRRRI